MADSFIVYDESEDELAGIYDAAARVLLGLAITDSPTFKTVILTDLSAGVIPIATTDGKLINGQTPLVGTKVYYVSDTSGGPTNRRLTFIDGILTSEAPLSSASPSLSPSVSPSISPSVSPSASPSESPSASPSTE